MPATYQGALRTTLRNTAAAYGYTLTIATSAAVLTTVRGKPRTGDLFLFVAGGLIAFVILEGLLLAFGRAGADEPDHAFPFAGALNFVSVGAGLAAATGVAHAVPSPSRMAAGGDGGDGDLHAPRRPAGEARRRSPAVSKVAPYGRGPSRTRTRAATTSGSN